LEGGPPMFRGHLVDALAIAGDEGRTTLR